MFPVDVPYIHLTSFVVFWNLLFIRPCLFSLVELNSIQAVAEAIGTLEKEVKGYTTVKEAKVANLTRFYKHRLPCSCLNKTKEKKVEKMGQCTFEGCGEMKPMVRLSACAGCQVATYCCVDCQRNDWPDHGKVCQTLANQKKEDLSEREEESTSNDVSETSAKEEDEEEAEEVVEEAPKKKDKKKKTEEKKKSEATGTEDKEKKKSKKKKKKAEA